MCTCICVYAYVCVYVCVHSIRQYKDGTILKPPHSPPNSWLPFNKSLKFLKSGLALDPQGTLLLLLLSVSHRLTSSLSEHVYICLTELP